MQEPACAFPAGRGYVRFVLPALIVIVFVAGYVPILQVWLGLG